MTGHCSGLACILFEYQAGGLRFLSIVTRLHNHWVNNSAHCSPSNKEDILLRIMILNTK